MCVDPVLGKVTVLQYHPSTSLCRCRDRQVCRWALEGHAHLPLKLFSICKLGFKVQYIICIYIVLYKAR